MLRKVEGKSRASKVVHSKVVLIQELEGEIDLFKLESEYAKQCDQQAGCHKVMLGSCAAMRHTEEHGGNRRQRGL